MIRLAHSEKSLDIGLKPPNHYVGGLDWRVNSKPEKKSLAIRAPMPHTEGMTSTTPAPIAHVPAAQFRDRWLAMTDDVVFEPEAVPADVWAAVVADATLSYGSPTHEVVSWGEAEDGSQDVTREVPADAGFLGAGLRYSGHVHGEPNRYNDSWVFAYEYNDRGHCAIVGVEVLADGGFDVSCYAD